jgi:hypothetical protein
MVSTGRLANTAEKVVSVMRRHELTVMI